MWTIPPVHMPSFLEAAILSRMRSPVSPDADQMIGFLLCGSAKSDFCNKNQGGENQRDSVGQDHRKGVDGEAEDKP
ncbi:hypothetical protein GETHLI_02700 [Geothrix limicola]|uniref:Uncharacterized protein n=1 Tax=Geothrix limicola TaxID=2927978 RepID=A0ABQ5QAP5_9BACT|nr:hypothetical protein GETHLI_02700 [Geothrix limicola]